MALRHADSERHVPEASRCGGRCFDFTPLTLRFARHDGSFYAGGWCRTSGMMTRDEGQLSSRDGSGVLMIQN